MVQEIRKNLYRIPVTLPNSPLKVLNSYVIKGDDRNLIIDTGFRRPECMQSIQEGLSELNIDMENTDIILTHLHADHSGLAADLATEQTRVFISRKELPWMTKADRKSIRSRDRSGFHRLGFPENELEQMTSSASWNLASDESFTAYLPIDDGECFTYGGYELRAIETPGHTPAHMCFWIEKEKIMLTGDHVLFDISPNITNWTELPDTLGAYLDSLRAIDKYDVELALPGHRETGNFHERIADIIAHHGARLEECLSIIQESPGRTPYEITGMMKWKIRSASWEDFPLGQKWFAVGEAFSHIWHLAMTGKVWIDADEEVVKVYSIDWDPEQK